MTSAALPACSISAIGSDESRLMWWIPLASMRIQLNLNFKVDPALGQLLPSLSIGLRELTLSNFIHTLLEDLYALPLVHALSPPLVHRTKRKILSEAVSRVWDNGFRSYEVSYLPLWKHQGRSELTEIIYPVKVRGGVGDIKPSEHEVDGVGVTGTKGLGETAADPRGGCGGEEGRVVAELSASASG